MSRPTGISPTRTLIARNLIARRRAREVCVDGSLRPIYILDTLYTVVRNWTFLYLLELVYHIAEINENWHLND